MRSKVLLPVLLLFMQGNELQAQSGMKDSLKSLLHKPIPDSTRSRILSKLGAQYMISDPDTALFYSQAGLALARKTGFIEGEIIGLNQTAGVLNIMGNYPKALQYFLEALKKAEDIGNGHRTGASLMNIGSVYYYQGDYQTAIIYSLRAKKIFDDLHDKYMIMTVNLNLGDYYEKWNKLDSANYYTQQSANMAATLGDIDFMGMSFNNLGNIYAKMGQPQIALDFYRSGLSNLLSVDNADAICECSLGMARIFAQRNEKDSCLYYCKLSVATAEKGGFTNRMLRAAGFLAAFYESIGMMDSAYAYLKTSNTAKDSLFSQERTKEIENLTFTETLRQHEKAEELAASKHERKLNIQYAILGICVISFAVIFLLLSRSIIVNEKWVLFLGMIGLLLVFEFLNLVLHPFISKISAHSPFVMLVVSVAVAAILVPLHHRGEHLIKGKLVEKNKRHRLAAAKRTVRKLDHDMGLRHAES